jgi:formylglycine-generating enzyme required for sulfatase activity
MRALVALWALRWFFGDVAVLPTGSRAQVARPGPEMVLVPAGDFLMGQSPDAVQRTVELCKRVAGAGPQQLRWCTATMLGDAEPEVRVLLGSYAIDRFEVTNAEYRACVRAGACAAEVLTRIEDRLSGPRQPVVGVTFEDAQRYCRFRNKRLPTEAEWEKAARGTGGRLWPWGDYWDPGATNHGRFDSPAALAQDWAGDEGDGALWSANVGSFPRDRSPFGVYDMAGNVSEWVDDAYGREPPQARSWVSPRGAPAGPWRSVRGGNWRMPAHMTVLSSRQGWPPQFVAPYLGFRCARDAHP